jgi:hypothetical protein
MGFPESGRLLLQTTDYKLSVRKIQYRGFLGLSFLMATKGRTKKTKTDSDPGTRDRDAVQFPYNLTLSRSSLRALIFLSFLFFVFIICD